MTVCVGYRKIGSKDWNGPKLQHWTVPNEKLEPVMMGGKYVIFARRNCVNPMTCVDRSQPIPYVQYQFYRNVLRVVFPNWERVLECFMSSLS